MDRRKRSDRESRELSGSRAGKLRAGLEVQPDFQLPAYVHLALDHFPLTAQSKRAFPKRTFASIPTKICPPVPALTCKGRAFQFPPNACRGERCGVWGRTTPINRFLRPTQNVQEPKFGGSRKKKGREPSIHRFRRETETSDIAHRPRVARGSCVASGSARLLRPAAATHPASRFF